MIWSEQYELTFGIMVQQYKYGKMFFLETLSKNYKNYYFIGGKEQSSNIKL